MTTRPCRSPTSQVSPSTLVLVNEQVRTSDGLGGRPQRQIGREKGNACPTCPEKKASPRAGHDPLHAPYFVWLTCSTFGRAQYEGEVSGLRASRSPGEVRFVYRSIGLQGQNPPRSLPLGRVIAHEARTPESERPLRPG